MANIVRLGDMQPWPTLESRGHQGGQGWDIFTKNTVDPESMFVIVQEYPPGGYTAGHSPHMDVEQAFYIMAGTMIVELADGEYPAPAGSFVFIPRGVEHNYRNGGPDSLRFITVNVPVRSGDVPPLRPQG